jgi:VanZ family protein
MIVSPRRKLLLWLPTLLWLCILASFSTDTFSAEHTGSILRQIIHAVYGPISHEQFQVIHFLVRKGAHFGSYGLLSVFAFYSWRSTLPARPRWTFRWSGLALALTLLAASLDEFHQSFVPSRTASPRDVLLDMMGALFFQILIASFIGLGKPYPGSLRTDSLP